MPSVGGTFSPPAPGDYNYDVNFNQAVDPASVQTSDLTLTGNVGGSVTSVQLINGNTTARFTVHFSSGGSVTASIGAGSITAQGCNANVAFQRKLHSYRLPVSGPLPDSTDRRQHRARHYGHRQSRGRYSHDDRAALLYTRSTTRPSPRLIYRPTATPSSRPQTTATSATDACRGSPTTTSSTHIGTTCIWARAGLAYSRR